jgi:O-antigen ligase
VTLRRALALLPALLFTPLLVVEWRGDGVTSLLRITGVLVLAVSAISPPAGLLVLAGVLPVATQLQVAAHAPMGGAQVAELMILAFLVAASVRHAIGQDVAPSRLTWPAVVAGAVVITAGIVQLGVEQQATSATPAAFFAQLREHVSRKYFSDSSAYPALHITMVWLEALLLAVYAERLLRQQPQLGPRAMRMFLTGAVAAASFAAIRLLEVSARTGTFWTSLVQYVRSLRLNPHYADLNAGGSYYVLALVPAIWLAVKRRYWLWVPSAVILLALWLTGSRAAMIAGVMTLAAAAVVGLRPRLLTLVAGGLVVAVAAVVLMRPREEAQQNEAYLGVRLRAELTMVGVRMAVAHPAFGVGPGQFRASAAPFVSPLLVEKLGSVAGVENAHNQFVQILAELGAVGLLAFLWILLAPGRAIARAISQKTAAPELTAMAWGLVAFLISALLGHPLLTTQVLFAFFLALGIAAGLVQEPAPAAGVRVKWLASAAVVALLVSVPFRMDAGRHAADLDNVMIGVSSVRGTVDDVRYRAAEPRAVWFVASATKSVTLPMRQAPDAGQPCRVAIAVDGQPATEVAPPSNAWLRVDLPLPSPSRPRASREIRVNTLAAGCRLLVGPLVKRQQ